MKVYLVSYDLNTPGKDYSALIDAICTYNGYCKALKSQWFVCSDGSAFDIYAHLKSYTDENDWLLVCEFTDNQIGWLPDEAVEWLNKIFRGNPSVRR